jgi:hypothetical protein
MATERIFRCVDGSAWIPSTNQLPKAANKQKRVVHVELPDNASIKGNEQEVWETATGMKGLHQSNKIRGRPADYIGYIHRGGGEKACFAVGYINPVAGYIRISAEGVVQDGWHEF